MLCEWVQQRVVPRSLRAGSPFTDPLVAYKGLVRTHTTDLQTLLTRFRKQMIESRGLSDTMTLFHTAVSGTLKALACSSQREVLMWHLSAIELNRCTSEADSASPNTSKSGSINLHKVSMSLICGNLNYAASRLLVSYQRYISAYQSREATVQYVASGHDKSFEAQVNEINSPKKW